MLIKYFPKHIPLNKILSDNSNTKNEKQKKINF